MLVSDYFTTWIHIWGPGSWVPVIPQPWKYLEKYLLTQNIIMENSLQNPETLFHYFINVSSKGSLFHKRNFIHVT